VIDDSIADHDDGLPANSKGINTRRPGRFCTRDDRSQPAEVGDIVRNQHIVRDRLPATIDPRRSDAGRMRPAHIGVQ
jgi:hypothetical protein